MGIYRFEQIRAIMVHVRALLKPPPVSPVPSQPLSSSPDEVGADVDADDADDGTGDAVYDSEGRLIKATGRVLKLSQCGIAIEKRFAFYDQIHTTGMDIKHVVNACAVITLGDDFGLVLSFFDVDVPVNFFFCFFFACEIE